MLMPFSTPLVLILIVLRILDEQSYILRDAEAEVLFDFSLDDSLKRAHSTPLFKVGFLFFLIQRCSIKIITSASLAF